MRPWVLRTTSSIAASSTSAARSSSPFRVFAAAMSSKPAANDQPAAAATPSTSTTTTTTTPGQDQDNQRQQQQQQQEVLNRPDRALPAPGSDAGATTLDISGGGSTVKLDALGPLVVNQDGTVSRIGNWTQMSDIERQNTLRILGKRNQARLAALRAQGQGLDMSGGQRDRGD